MNRVTTPFGATSTAADVIEGLDLEGKRAVVTGASSGIGFETALALASAGAEVTLAVRNLQAGAEAAQRIEQRAGRANVRVVHVDLADRASIRGFVDGWSGALDILVNNAGTMAIPERRLTADAWESQFAVNHLGPAALTLGLHSALAAARGARVVMVASSAHLISPVDFDDVHFESRPYDAWAAYAQSKTATILFTTALAKRWDDDAITVNALHPGGIMTNLQRHLDDAALAFVGAKDALGNTLEVPPGWKTPEQGAATTVLLAASPIVEGISGRYFEDANEALLQPEPAAGKAGVAGYAVDPDLAEHLWNLTARLLG